MRIGIEAQRLLRSNKHGVDIVALNLLRHLPEVDRVNDYVLFVRDGVDRECLSSLKNIRIVILSALSYADWEQVELPLAVQRENIDVLHCTGSTVPLLVSIPVLLTLHDVIFRERDLFGDKRQNPYQRFGNAYRRMIAKRVLSGSMKIVTVSEFERATIRAQYPRSTNPIEVIHNGVDDIFSQPVPARDIRDVQSTYGLPPRYFLHFGNSDPKKNTALVISAYAAYARQTDNIIPLVVTDMPRASIEEQLRIESAIHLQDSIITPGYVNHADVPAVYASAAALLYPSQRESFGLPMLEAMAAGVPVITTQLSALPEIAGDAALFLESESAPELSACMSMIQQDEEKTRIIIAKGRERARNFSWRRTAEAYVREYTSFRPLRYRPAQVRPRWAARYASEFSYS